MDTEEGALTDYMPSTAIEGQVARGPVERRESDVDAREH